MVIQLISKYWWAFTLRGSLAVIFGLVALFSPAGVTLGALVIVFGFYALLEGILLIGSAIGASEQDWWVLLFQGIVSMLAWIFTLTWPGTTAPVLLSLIAIWALIEGILEIVGAIRLRMEVKGEWAFVLSGIVSILFALILLVNPLAGALDVVWIIGIYAIIVGALMIALGFRIHKMVHG